jgi:ribosomal protein S18 acetylase RimI-like enzyme
VEQVGGSWAAIFPASPADRIFNNALLVAGPDELISSIAALGDAYSTAGISNQALWCHEDDAPAGLALERHGYGLDETTRCMGGFLDEMGGVAVRDPRVRLGDPSELFSVNELDANLLTGLVFGAGRCYALDCGDGPQAVLLAFDCDGDCGLSFLATVPAARRRGHARALVGHALADARERGCRTTTLQATPMAEGLYAAIGYRDLGRFLEYRRDS